MKRRLAAVMIAAMSVTMLTAGKKSDSGGQGGCEPPRKETVIDVILRLITGHGSNPGNCCPDSPPPPKTVPGTVQTPAPQCCNYNSACPA